ncbi:Xre family transcriptional regulator [Paraburkholderia unamae]|nr:Xre family transcriptional regulator [Paraburkholderia unamae]
MPQGLVTEVFIYSITAARGADFTSDVMVLRARFARIGGMNTLASTLPATAAGAARRSVGEMLRDWRMRRRMSQLLLATEAEISTRHLSFVESGRALPSREMVMHLAEQLDVPLRERNALLMAAGYAPLYRERALDDPQLAAAREAVDLVLRGHEPYPAVAVDRHWNIVAANGALAPLIGDASPALLDAPINALRLSLHPAGIAPRIVNWHAWRAHLLTRLQRQIDASGDPALAALHEELAAYPTPPGVAAASIEPLTHHIAVPLRVRTALGELAFYSTTTVFGTPVDITLSELAIEAFFPADPQTAQALRDAMR